VLPTGLPLGTRGSQRHTGSGFLGLGSLYAGGGGKPGCPRSEVRPDGGFVRQKCLLCARRHQRGLRRRACPGKLKLACKVHVAHRLAVRDQLKGLSEAPLSFCTQCFGYFELKVATKLRQPCTGKASDSPTRGLAGTGIRSPMPSFYAQ
jgi:hypothetical protein